MAQQAVLIQGKPSERRPRALAATEKLRPLSQLCVGWERTV